MIAPSLAEVLKVARQVPVFPCRVHEEWIEVDGKRVRRGPKSPYTTDGFKAASQDPDQIEYWYRQYPDCLWGVPTGRVTRLIVLDYDPSKVTPATDEWIEAHTAVLMQARIHTTGRAGRHYVYRATNGAIYTCGTDVTLDGKKRPGLDIRGEGGYVIWWPLQGLHEQGTAPELPAELLKERAFHGISDKPTLPPSPAKWAKDQYLVAAALAYLDPENYEAWIKVGISLHFASEGGDSGFQLWHAWSAGEVNGTSPKSYGGIEICRDKWDSFGKRYAPIKRTLGSLFREAKEAGWVYQQARTNSEPPPVDPEDPGPGGRTSPVRPMPHFNDTDMANAVRMARQHGRDIRYVREGKWLIWDDRRWWIDDKGVAIQGLAKQTAESIYDEIKLAEEPKEMFKHARRSQAKASIEAMISLTRSETGVLSKFADFDTDPWLLNVRNGTLHLKTGELRPHRREDHITKFVDVSYDETADCEIWDSFLQFITMCDDKLYKYLQRLIGYCLTGSTNEQVLHFLYGLGANGKSVFCEVLAELLGDYAIIVSPEMVMHKKHQGIPNDIARLRGVRLAMMNETSQGARFDEAKLKDLTGSDSLTARFLNAEFFDFKPTHKLIIRGNHKPVISGTDEGIWRRLRLVPFMHSVPIDEQDKEMINHLREELPGILKWAVQGCLDWQREGLNPPATILDAVKEYREESDTLGRFIEEQCLVSQKNAQVKTTDFFKRYQEFAEAARERWIPYKDMPHEMQRRGYEHKRGAQGTRLYVGIELRASEAKNWMDDRD